MAEESGLSVSVIIVNYNAGEYLQSCVESIRLQTLREHEIIIVDNCSTDRSLDWLFWGNDIRLVKNECNLGFAAAQNQGMRLARGRYLMPLNFDILLEHRFLEEMVAAMGLSERIGAVSGKLLRLTEQGQSNVIDNAGLLLSRRRVPLHRGRGEVDAGQYDEYVRVFGAMGAAALYRREMLEDIAYNGQYFDESYFMWYEDIDLDWRARLRGWDCLYTPRAVAYHVGDVHGHGRSRLGARVSMRNRWKTILTNECAGCLARNCLHLLGEELALLGHVARFGLFREYMWAVSSLLTCLPEILKKRRWVRSRAKLRCLPDYPLAF